MSASIIGGSDGPTSIFIAGNKEKNIYWRIRCNYRRRKDKKKREKVMKFITPQPHSMDELISYITSKYHARELNRSDSMFIMRYRNLKAALVMRKCPELAGEMPKSLKKADYQNKEAVKAYLDGCQKYQEAAQNVDDSAFPMDYHCYLIEVEGHGEVYVEMDKIHDAMGADFTVRQADKRPVERIWKDIYLYYGVSKEDIFQNTERLRNLVEVLVLK